MTNVGFATLSVIPSFNGFQNNLERGTAAPLAASGKRGGLLFGRSAGKAAGSSFGSAFRGTLGALGVFTAASGALRFLGDSVAEGREVVRIGAQTRAVIKSTGGVAKVSEKQVGRLAGQLSRMAGIDDELIQSGGNVLLSFKNVRNEVGEGNKVYDEGLKAALDLSVAMDKDLKGSVVQVGKALNDPVAGLTALGRAGVQFSADQKDAIKDFVASGDTLSAQKIILKELDDQFAGSAKAQRTEAGRLKVAWGNFKEEIGTALIPILEDLAKFMRKEGIPKAKEFFGVLKDDGVPAVKKVAGFAKDAAGKVKSLVDEFNGMPGWVKKVLAGGVIGGTVAVKLGGGDLFKRGATPLNPLYVLDVSGGGGTGVPKGTSLLSKLGLFGAVLTPAAIGLNELHDFHRGDDKNGLASLGRGGINDWFDEKVLGKKSEAQLEALQSEWDETRNRASDYFRLLERNKDVQLRFTVTGIDLATQKARDYYALLLQIQNAHVTSGFSADGTTGSTPGQVPNHSPGKGGGSVTRGTVNFNGPVTVNGTKELERLRITKQHQAALGGFGS